MSKYFAVILALFCIGAQAQTCPTNRYLDPQFSVTKHSNVVFANAPSIPAVYVSEAVTVNQDITMDIFEPAGDTVLKRPLIIFAFGGGYIFGTKDDSDIQGLCDYFAKRGYVTASINYRKGLNATSNTSAVRAIYRGAQDWSAAIRWFKEYANTYRIDTNYFFVGGSSAGSFGAMHAAFADDSNKPAEANATGFPTFNPDLGCLSCSGNNFNHSNKVKAILNCWGALLSKNFIDANDDVSILSVHGTADPIVPIGSGSPFSASIVVQSVDGSAPIHQRCTQVGVPSKFVPFDGEGHCVWGICVLNAWAPGSPTEYYSPILDTMRLYMYPMLLPTTPTVNGPTSVCQGDTGVYWLSGSNALRYCWQISGGQLIDHTTNYGAIKVVWNTAGNYTLNALPYSQLAAEGTAVQTSVTVNGYPPLVSITENNDTLTVPTGYSYQWYANQQPITNATTNSYVVDMPAFYSVELTGPGGCTTMSESLYAVPKDTTTQPTALAEEKINVKIYPQPTTNRFVLEGNNIIQIAIYNTLGQMVIPSTTIQSGNKWYVEHTMPKGIYYIKISTKQGVVNKALVVE